MNDSFTVEHVDLSVRVAYLRQLAADFDDLRSQAVDFDTAPGTALLRAAIPLYLRAQGLAARLAAQVTGLGASPYAQVPGSRESLDALRGAIGTAALAASDNAQALAANPLQGTRLGGPSEHEARFRDHDHVAAAPVLTEHFQKAAHHLELCSAICHYVAHGITKDTTAVPETTALPAPAKLNAEQYEALTALAHGGARLEVRDRRAHIATLDGTQVTTHSFRSLDALGLLHHDASVPLRRGRDITVTAEGHRALAHRPQPVLPPSAAPTPPAPTPAAVRVVGR
ncbi:hypothetical protein HXS80_06245 [Streptomyces sp. CB04723]|uniref:hypothetical protein n=1 Tax=Streptomyces TaxID=1883 RepID=UPI0015C46D49|nr:hypothetical protein [Streptomyces sp. CB04723]QLG31333.1 hypothetical protein HXS80_06245 [Streptomyces sp. CB04723]